jgi:L-2-hydroxyglutarate oxidase LhgO
MTAITPDIETVVIGAGIVGLAIAAELSARGQDVLVLERNDGIGQETSSRSSEVIHAGIYYPNGSLKARLCVEGKARLYAFAAENSVGLRRTGKLIVATSEPERAMLDGIAAAARANGVDDLKYLTATEARALEPEVAAVAALLSPSTGIVDSHGMMVALEGHLTSRGGAVVLTTEVTGITQLPSGIISLETISNAETSTLTARRVVASAGHGMATLQNRLRYRKNYAPPPQYLAKGHYFTLIGPCPFRHLIYPVPVDGGLGTHLTLDLQGRARFGPDVQWIDRLDYAFDDPGGARTAAFEASIRRYWPGLPAGALAHGYTGIRPKLSGKDQPPRDFEIHGAETHGVANFVALYGIESPGISSALAIGPYVAAQLQYDA